MRAITADPLRGLVPGRLQTGISMVRAGKRELTSESTQSRAGSAVLANRDRAKSRVNKLPGCCLQMRTRCALPSPCFPRTHGSARPPRPPSLPPNASSDLPVLLRGLPLPQLENHTHHVLPEEVKLGFQPLQGATGMARLWGARGWGGRRGG